MAKPDYIGEEWFSGTPETRAADARVATGANELRQALDMPAQPTTAASGGPQVYGGLGGYQYEVRGNDIYITGSHNKKVAQPIRVDPNTERGAKAYNAIIAELAPEGVTLKPVRVPAARAAEPPAGISDDTRNRFVSNVAKAEGTIDSMYNEIPPSSGLMYTTSKYRR
tara:strand:- start:644 stop:1147 length:504 start_codon:yes stop_codon:yes gene_type:complete